jgi:rfaE bifunctional protein kinase chain/domain
MHAELDLDGFFEGILGMPILVVGDAMVDAYITGTVDRVSPEAPVPVVHATGRQDRLGGAANVALNLAAMGAEPRLVTMLGQDEAAERFLGRMEANALRTDWCLRSPSRRTTVKTRVLCRGQQMMRIDEETTAPLDREDSGRLIEAVRDALSDGLCQGAVFQDYDKGVLHDGTIPAVNKRCHQAGLPVCVDPKRQHFGAYRNVALFKPNLREVRESLPDLDVTDDPDSLDRAAHAIRERLDNAVTLITLGEKGLFLQVGGQSRLYPAHRRDIADVSGAGDTVISVAALGLAAGLDTGVWARLANLAGGQVCEHVGVVPVDRERLRAEAAQVFAEG